VFDNKTLGVIGAGNMAEALVGGVLGSSLIKPEMVVACDPTAERRAKFSDMGVRVSEDNSDAAACDIILLAVKPQMMFDVLAGIGDKLGPDKLIISIAAGIRTAKISKVVKEGTRIVRVMPNTPMLVGAGMSAVAGGCNSTAQDVEMVLDMCAAAGESCEVEENLLDAVTAVSGSGPAYLFLFTELLADAAIHVGLDPVMARKLAQQTVIGSATLMANSEDTPAELRRKVTSPNGTTEAAIKEFMSCGFDKVLQNGVNAACRRSVELSG